MLRVIADVNRDLGTTAVVITHNAVIAAIASRVLRMADGVIAAVDINQNRADVESLRW